MGPPLSITIPACKPKGAHPAQGGETDRGRRGRHIQKAAFSRDYRPGQQSERDAPPKHMEVRASFPPSQSKTAPRGKCTWNVPIFIST